MNALSRRDDSVVLSRLLVGAQHIHTMRSTFAISAAEPQRNARPALGSIHPQMPGKGIARRWYGRPCLPTFQRYKSSGRMMLLVSRSLLQTSTCLSCLGSQLYSASVYTHCAARHVVLCLSPQTIIFDNVESFRPLAYPASPSITFHKCLKSNLKISPRRLDLLRIVGSNLVWINTPIKGRITGRSFGRL